MMDSMEIEQRGVAYSNEVRVSAEFVVGGVA